jgi:hypothetical protein
MGGAPIPDKKKWIRIYNFCSGMLSKIAYVQDEIEMGGKWNV